MSKKRGKGNIKAQRRRRNQRRKYYQLVKWRPHEYELIDMNYSHYPAAFCKHYGRYLTIGLIDTHKCIDRNCHQLAQVEQT